MTNQVALLANYEQYSLETVACGFVEPAADFDPKKKMFMFGDGRWITVSTSDLVEIELTEKQKIKLFPLYD